MMIMIMMLMVKMHFVLQYHIVVFVVVVVLSDSCKESNFIIITMCVKCLKDTIPTTKKHQVIEKTHNKRHKTKKTTKKRIKNENIQRAFNQDPLQRITNTHSHSNSQSHSNTLESLKVKRKECKKIERYAREKQLKRKTENICTKQDILPTVF